MTPILHGALAIFIISLALISLAPLILCAVVVAREIILALCHRPSRYEVPADK